ncbi:MAG TPA: 2-oxo acid dehydrogenase subunit E2 [Chloroflexota bacterium]|nr:2-oxo acid dehydrogenase subunit E2 [Chloroflexota bacterium]
MAADVVMPRLGWSMEEGSLVEWVKHEGELVKVGDIICRIEGDKAIDDVEAFDEGILRIPSTSPKPGEKVPVGTLLAYLVKPGEEAPFESSGPASVAMVEPKAATVTAGAAVANVPTVQAWPSPARSDREPPISPRARRVAAELGVEWTSVAGSGSTGRIVERDVRQAAAVEGESGARISPLVRKIAEELGVDLDELARARPGQRITRADVDAAAEKAKAPMAPLPSVAPRTVTPMTGVRQIIATRLAQSAHTVAPVTLTTDADATNLVRLRDQIKADLAGTDDPVPSYNDLLAKIAATGLLEHPALNASLVGEEIVQHPTINVGVAVDTERGLLVPVIRDVQTRSVHQIAAESARLIAATRTGRLAGDDLRGGTFTITNLGMFDIDAFTPIINLPECAILGVGRILARPVVVDEATETIAVRKMVALSLTFDHRLVDGGPAARFLQRIKYLIEHPTLSLLG